MVKQKIVMSSDSRQTIIGSCNNQRKGWIHYKCHIFKDVGELWKLKGLDELKWQRSKEFFLIDLRSLAIFFPWGIGRVWA